MRMMQVKIEEYRRRLDREPLILQYPDFAETLKMKALRGIVKLLVGQVAEGKALLDRGADQLSDLNMRMDALLLLAASADLAHDPVSKEKWLQEARQWQAQEEALQKEGVDDRYRLWLDWLRIVRQ
ncbi:MAG: hypothetical protein HSCHL_1445 [Hydrogenibacillus schlegelii]|uniref:Uncharacterized protein n=2 Tax=Hydrogenibacillus schlegelii TaxID=1484 RepID=A0A2T5GCB2_HYDSH|nr:MAG: hypothetical protein HSCHL_1445 [Hydrogenibacillus schlegelii]